MSTLKIGSMASAALYFCGTAMLAAAILLIPFVYKPAAAPCECPPVAPASLAEGGAKVVAPASVPQPLPSDSQKQEGPGGIEANVFPQPASPSVGAAAVQEATQEAQGAVREPASGEQGTSGTDWRFEFGQDLKLSDEQIALARGIGEQLKAQPKARAVVIGHVANEAGSTRAKNAARLVRDEVAKAGISSKRMTTDVAQNEEVDRLVVTVELKYPQ